MSEEEYAVFNKTLQEKLPVTFRVNQTEVNHEVACRLFTDPNFIANYYKQGETIKEGVEISEDDLKNKALDLS